LLVYYFLDSSLLVFGLWERPTAETNSAGRIHADKYSKKRGLF